MLLVFFLIDQLYPKLLKIHAYFKNKAQVDTRNIIKLNLHIIIPTGIIHCSFHRNEVTEAHNILERPVPDTCLCDRYSRGTVSEPRRDAQTSAINCPFSFPPLHPKKDHQTTKTTHSYSRHVGLPLIPQNVMLLRMWLPNRQTHSNS